MTKLIKWMCPNCGKKMERAEADGPPEGHCVWCGNGGGWEQLGDRTLEEYQKSIPNS